MAASSLYSLTWDKAKESALDSNGNSHFARPTKSGLDTRQVHGWRRGETWRGAYSRLVLLGRGVHLHCRDFVLWYCGSLPFHVGNGILRCAHRGRPVGSLEVVDRASSNKRRLLSLDHLHWCEVGTRDSERVVDAGCGGGSWLVLGPSSTSTNGPLPGHETGG